MHAARRTKPNGLAELCIFKPSREPLAARAGDRLNPAHVLQVHMEMDATGAHQALLVFWTMSSGVAVYRLRRSDALIAALQSTAGPIHSHLMGLPPDALVDLCFIEGIAGVLPQGRSRPCDSDVRSLVDARRDAGFKELGLALLAYLKGDEWTLERSRNGKRSRYLLGRDYRGDPECLEHVWIVDESISESRLGPSKATAALRDPSSSRFFGILSPRFKQVRAYCRRIAARQQPCNAIAHHLSLRTPPQPKCIGRAGQGWQASAQQPVW
jgi:hypothetical protein